MRKSETQEVLDFVNDHKKHFDCYPMEVETSSGVLTWDQYWTLIDEVNS